MSTGIVIGIVMIFAGIAVMLISSSRPNKIEASGGTLVISGNYAISVNTDEIKTAELLDSLPKITMRTNGIAFGNSMTGHFRMKGIGACRLYLKKNRPPFVHIVTSDGKHIFFNTEDPSRTRDLFEAIASDGGTE